MTFFNLKIMAQTSGLYHVVWLGPPIHKYIQDFPSFLFADPYTSLNLSSTSIL